MAKEKSASIKEADAKQVSRFAHEHGAVYTVAFRPDGREVAVGGFDGMLRIYDPDTGALVRQFVPVPLSAGTVAQQAK